MYTFKCVFVCTSPIPVAAMSKAWVAAARQLGLRVLIPLEEWILVSVLCFRAEGSVSGCLLVHRSQSEGDVSK